MTKTGESWRQFPQREEKCNPTYVGRDTFHAAQVEFLNVPSTGGNELEKLITGGVCIQRTSTRGRSATSVDRRRAL